MTPSAHLPLSRISFQFPVRCRHEMCCCSTGEYAHAFTSAAQECKETARSQIEAVLDESTNRILLSKVVSNFGEEGKRLLLEIAGDESRSAKRRGEAIRLLGEYRSDAGRGFCSKY